MNKSEQKFHRWWQVPPDKDDPEEERRITFLELFYDLVYVVLISEVTHALAEEINFTAVGQFLFMFIMVWWAWFNGAMFYDHHGNVDVRTRVFTFLQMFIVGGMAIFAGEVFGEGDVGFVVCFVAYQLLLTFLWWRGSSRRYTHARVARPYILTYLLSALLMFTSIFVSPPGRYYLWFATLLADMFLPLLLFNLRADHSESGRKLHRFINITPALVERFDLFTIIVLGEVIVAVIRGMAAHHDLTELVILTGVLGMLLSIGLWWIYFDYIARYSPLDRRSKMSQWVYLHLLITIGIAASGAAILVNVEFVDELIPYSALRLLGFAVALALVSIALVLRVIHSFAVFEKIHQYAFIILLLAAGGTILTGFFPYTVLTSFLMLNVLLLVPIMYGLKLWIEKTNPEDLDFLD